MLAASCGSRGLPTNPHPHAFWLVHITSVFFHVEKTPRPEAERSVPAVSPSDSQEPRRFALPPLPERRAVVQEGTCFYDLRTLDD